MVSKGSFPRVPLLIICSNEMEDKFLAMWIRIRMGKSVSLSLSLSLSLFLSLSLSLTHTHTHLLHAHPFPHSNTIPALAAASCHSSITLVDYLQVDLSDTASSRHSEQQVGHLCFVCECHLPHTMILYLSLSLQLSRALCQLAKQSPPQPHLFHLPVREFVEQGMYVTSLAS